MTLFSHVMSFSLCANYHWISLVMAIYPSIWVAPSNFQHGENSRIIYVHVLATWMSLLIYIAMVGVTRKTMSQKT